MKTRIIFFLPCLIILMLISACTGSATPTANTATPEVNRATATITLTPTLAPFTDADRLYFTAVTNLNGSISEIAETLSELTPPESLKEDHFALLHAYQDMDLLLANMLLLAAKGDIAGVAQAEVENDLAQANLEIVKKKCEQDWTQFLSQYGESLPTSIPPTPTPIPLTPVPAGEIATNNANLSIEIGRINWDAWEVIQAENRFNSAPENGKEILIELTLSNNASKPVEFSKFDFSLEDLDNTIYTAYGNAPYNHCGVFPNPIDEVNAVNKNLDPGKSVTGNICFQIPDDDRELILNYLGLRLLLPVREINDEILQTNVEIQPFTDYPFTYNIVEVNWDAWKTVLNPDNKKITFPEPPRGKERYVIIRNQFANEGSEAITMYERYFTLIDPSGEEHSPARCGDFYYNLFPDSYIPYEEIAAEQTINKGDVCFLVPFSEGQYVLNVKFDNYANEYNFVLPNPK